MKRRDYLALTGSAATAALAGCLPNPVDQVEDLPRPVLGDEQSSTVLRVFEDIGCPNCRRYNLNVYPSLKENYIDTGNIRYEYYDFVVGASPLSDTLANAARGVQDRLGQDEFWQYLKVLFERQNEMNLDVIETEAINIGVEEVDEFMNDIQGGVYDPVINNDEDIGSDEYGVSAVPSLVLNDTLLSSSTGQSYRALESVLEQSLGE